MDRKLAESYIRKKRRKKGAAIIGTVSTVMVCIFALIAFLLMKIDRFTIVVQEPELTLSIKEDRSATSTLLYAPPLLEATDTQYTDIPENIEDGIGSKNSRSYFAYSFWLIGVGNKENINYSLSMSLINTSNNIEEAIRVMIIKDGERSVFSTTSKPIYHAQDHTKTPEQIGETKPYWDKDHIALLWDKIIPGDYAKYTIVIWIDGWESVDSMKAGTFSASLEFSTKLNK